ncbi:MAG: glucosaminidase domain-containing protein [Bacteroidales bacterium]|nr:glucosaminidase domain-containing protein [Bacteroidales bacterium]
MRNCTAYIFIILVILLNSCSSSRKAARRVAPSGSTQSYVTEYLNKYNALAVSEMKRTGIPASITLAQGMLESNYGRSTLAVKGNNHFGIKCHNNWRGARIYHDDNRRGECFRAYTSAEESYRDHSEFLVNGSRYRDLFSLSSTDYRGWAHGLKKAGYATDPNYAQLLIRKIDEYGLHDYDTGRKRPGEPVQKVSEAARAVADPGTAGTVPATVPARVPTAGSARVPATASATPQKEVDTTVAQRAQSEAQTPREEEAPIKVISLGSGKKIQENNNVEYILAGEADTYESLAEKYQLLAWEISRYNDLAPGSPLQPGQVIYLQPKRTKAAQGFSVHTVTPGETMYSISQKYAIRLSSLYKLNVMTEGTECKPGQKLRLR